MVSKLMTVAIVALMAVVTLPVQAAAYLKLEGIQGESTDEAHKKWSDLVSMAWGTPKPAPGGPKNGEPSEVPLGDVVVVKSWDSAAPRIQQAIGEKLVIPSATIEIFDDGGQLRQVYELQQVRITSYSVHASGLDDGAVPVVTESFSLNYEEIRSVAFPIDRHAPPQEWYYVPDASQ